MFINTGQVRQIFAVFGCLIGVMTVSLELVWFSPIIARMKNGDSIKLNNEESSWLMSIVSLVSLIGGVLTAMTTDKFGRKTVLWLNFPIFLISFLLLITTRSIWMLYFIRTLQGVTLGSVYSIAPVYLAEISEPKIRGAICGSMQTFSFLGYLYAYTTGPFLSYNSYTYAGAALKFLFGLLFAFAPESPFFYALVGQEEKAEKTLSWLRGGNDIIGELGEIRRCVSHSLQRDKKGFWVHFKELFTDPAERRSLLILSSVCFVKYMGGFTYVTIYLTETLQHAIASTSAQLISIYISLIMVVSSAISSFVSDALGRRPLILFSIFGCIFFNLTNAVYFYLVKINITGVERYNWVSCTSLIGYVITTCLGIHPLMQTFQGELFTSERKAAGSGFIILLITVLFFVSAKQYESIFVAFGDYANFVVYTIVSLLGSLVILSYLKETAGRTFEEIQQANKLDVKKT